ncbi:hypothetical protein HY489_05030 [Candidatus Woesearchaeota archaeon]|nr:hypothetical protein [Candidatus Woesearchaeota archaeon]
MQIPWQIQQYINNPSSIPKEYLIGGVVLIAIIVWLLRGKKSSEEMPGIGHH